MILLYILYALVVISIIIFIHEAGHFLAAKRVGVRVERFSIGFDPPIRGRNLRVFSFRKGETEYVLGMIPFGGYVKLAGGEVPSDSEKKPAKDELLAKGVGARSLVFAAGSAMNILSAFFFFMVAFTLGVSFAEPQIGQAIPGFPAWQSGLKSGDAVVAINGEEVTDFHDMTLMVALGKRSTPMRFTISRPTEDGSGIFDVNITPRWNPQHGINEIGVEPAISNVILERAPETAAARAGLKAGDKIVGLEVYGQRLPPVRDPVLMNAIARVSLLRAEEPFKVLVSRESTSDWVELTPRKKAGAEKSPQIGVLPSPGTVARAIQEGSEASRFLKPRDEVLRIDGERVGTIDWLQILEKWPGKAGMLELTVTSLEGSPQNVRVEREALLRWVLRGEIQWDSYSCKVATLDASSTLGLRPGDTITDLNDAACYSPDEIPGILEKDQRAKFSIRFLREGRSSTITVERSALENLSAVTWQTMPWLAAVTSGGPAQKAGITAGSTLLRLGPKELRSWEDLMAQVTSLKPGAEAEVAWRTADGEEKKGSVTVGLEPMEPLGLADTLRQRKVQVGVLESFALGAKRTVISSKQILLTLKSLIRRDVSATNLAGPVGITHQLTIVVEQGTFTTLLYFLALISINLGLLNLLPFPILDGGHLVFLAIEKIKGSPVDVRVQEWAMNIAFFLILTLAVYVTFNDIRRLIR